MWGNETGTRFTSRVTILSPASLLNEFQGLFLPIAFRGPAYPAGDQRIFHFPEDQSLCADHRAAILSWARGLLPLRKNLQQLEPLVEHPAV